MPTPLSASYRFCRQVVRQSASNLASTFWLLPRQQRMGMEALYAFARYADDLSDAEGESLLGRQTKLKQLWEEVRGKKSTDGMAWPGMLALHDTAQRYAIDLNLLEDLITGVELDLVPPAATTSSFQVQLKTFEDLRHYCYHVASVVGLACLKIWGCTEKLALGHAVDCGLAFQLTNILRDLREDAGRGRVYLPADELRQFGVEAADLATGRVSPGMRELLAFQIARAEQYYLSARHTTQHIPAAGRRIFRLMLGRYEAILAEVKRRGAEGISQRVKLSYGKKLLVAGQVLLGSDRTSRNGPQQDNAHRFTRDVAKQFARRKVTIIGGGLAGLATAVALARKGIEIELLEGKQKLGGRATSYSDRATGEQIDHCQHVSLGCCTSLAHFCEMTGIAGDFTRYQQLTFFAPDGTANTFAASKWLPAPLHLAKAFGGLSYLTLGEKFSLGRTLLKLARSTSRDKVDSPSIGAWLVQQRQTPATIERFWQVVLVSALGESLERASLSAARKVFVDGFMAHPQAFHLLVPNCSLGELFDGKVSKWLKEKGVQVQVGVGLRTVHGDRNGITEIELSDGNRRPIDQLVLALPWNKVAGVLAPSVTEALQQTLLPLSQIHPSPITGVHLWFDRPLTDLPHAVLVGRLSQWVFARGKMELAGQVAQEQSAYYYQVVISASRELDNLSREQILTQIQAELKELWPASRDARLLQAKVVKEHEAVFSVTPGLDQIRPTQQTPISNLLLAGDWTYTQWPATLEGAVRSGFLAAQRVQSNLGWYQPHLALPLPASWLARWLGIRS